MTDITTPHLQIAATGPLQLLEKKILTSQIHIESWFRKQWRLTPPPVYCSVDLRNAGFKVAPVDTNLFPAGFNNLNPDSIPLCVQAAQNALEKIAPVCQHILLIIESHSRNIFYFENVAVIQQILSLAGFEVSIGSVAKELTDIRVVNLPSGKSITIEPITRVGSRIYAGTSSPCIIILNHDLSEGIPEILENTEQKILPPLSLGWANRLKSQHFKIYQQICEEFSQFIDIDPWLINPIHRRCAEVDFMTRGGEQCLAKYVGELLEQIQMKYHEYGIDKKPFVVIKADAGTYGMGVMMVDDPKQVYDLNRKQRKKMAVSKGGKIVNKVIIQEGVYTFETIEQHVAEPVIYMIGPHVVGGFYRIHTEKGPDENLNAPGMQFKPLAFSEPCNLPDIAKQEECCANRFYTYGVIARLALLAAAREQATVIASETPIKFIETI